MFACIVVWVGSRMGALGAGKACKWFAMQVRPSRPLDLSANTPHPPPAQITQCAPEVAVPPSLCLNESWSFEDLHDDMNAKVVNEIGVPVTLTQILRSAEAECSTIMAVLQPAGVDVTVREAVQQCEAGAKAATVGGDEVLSKRKEKIRETMSQRRRAKSKPSLSLSITQPRAT